MPQLASIPKEKRQAARQPTDNGTDEASNERKPKQRAGSGTEGARPFLQKRRRLGPNPANILTLCASFKRLIPYSKQALKGFQLEEPEGMPLWKKPIFTTHSR